MTIQQRMDIATGRALERHLIAEAEAEADERRYRKLTAHRELVQWAEDRAKKRLALGQVNGSGIIYVTTSEELSEDLRG